MSQEIGDATAPRLGSPDVSVEIRQFAGRDALSTWQVFQAAVRQLAVRDYTVEQVSAWAPETVDLATWQKRRERAFTLVAVTDGQLAGFTDLTDLTDLTDTGLVDMLFVHPDHAGRGVGRLLLEAVIDTARACGLTRLHTHASRTAQPVFERLGFITDRLNESNWIRGQNLPNYDMHLDL